MKTLGKIVLIILAVLGVLFILLMLLPDDDEGEKAAAREAVTEKEAEEETAEEPEEESAEEKPETVRVSSKFDMPINGKPGKEDVVTVGKDTGTATVMVYMNGSDLETKQGEATRDIEEMIAGGVGENVNVVIQTMGTKKWHGHGISSKTAQTWRIEDGELKKVRDDLGQLDCTNEETLSEFIGFCKDNYPAQRYMFIFWDHGGGPVYGFGYDEWQGENESLTLDEIARAFGDHKDIHFDIIGMDCCIMASLETCVALAPYCKYAILSEDFESPLGWSYTKWMKRFEEKPGISTSMLGKNIVDQMIEANEQERGGDSACMGLFNLQAAGDLFDAWKDYAYLNESRLFESNFSKSHKAKGRFFGALWGSDGSSVTMSDYYISDLLAIIESVDKDSDEAKRLMSTLKACVAYCGHTPDNDELTGLAVSLPYGDREFYGSLKDVYSGVGLDDDYIDWLGSFVGADGYEDYFDYGDFEENWCGWGQYEDEYGCNISSGASCECAYDYDSGDDYDYDDDGSFDDWLYDCEEEIWYTYDDETLYLYDDDSDTLFYYDEEDDLVFYYDEETEDWYEAE